jgi:hypothetical protein
VLINRRDVGWGRKEVPYKYPRRVTPHEAAKKREEGEKKEQRAQHRKTERINK